MKESTALSDEDQIVNTSRCIQLNHLRIDKHGPHAEGLFIQFEVEKRRQIAAMRLFPGQCDDAIYTSEGPEPLRQLNIDSILECRTSDFDRRTKNAKDLENSRRLALAVARLNAREVMICIGDWLVKGESPADTLLMSAASPPVPLLSMSHLNFPKSQRLRDFQFSDIWRAVYTAKFVEMNCQRDRRGFAEVYHELAAVRRAGESWVSVLTRHYRYGAGWAPKLPSLRECDLAAYDNLKREYRLLNGYMAQRRAQKEPHDWAYGDEAKVSTEMGIPALDAMVKFRKRNLAANKEQAFNFVSRTSYGSELSPILTYYLRILAWFSIYRDAGDYDCPERKGYAEVFGPPAPDFKKAWWLQVQFNDDGEKIVNTPWWIKDKKLKRADSWFRGERNKTTLWWLEENTPYEVTQGTKWP